MTEKFSNYTNAMYNRYARVRSKVEDIYSKAKSFHSTHQIILDELGEVYHSVDYKKLNSYYRGYIAGINHTYLNQLHRYELEWQLWFDHQWLESHDKRITHWQALDGRHAWKGTQYPFNDPKPLDASRWSERIEQSENENLDLESEKD